MAGKPFFTMEDAKMAFNLFCCVYGIGTLGMPGNFSRAGPVIACLALVFMAFANIYASVVCSKVMLVAPRSVKTYGDLGEWCMGKFGRYAVVVSQMGVCLLIPCAFLVLGGTLLNNLFPEAFSQSVWIIFMASMVMPVCLIPTMKEGAGAAFAGCMGTIIADVIGVSVLLHGMKGHPAVIQPDITFKQVATAFGNLSLAYGAGIVIPALQRQHSDPTRMPRVVFVTLSFVSVLFLALAGSGYSAVGCQISGNLLFTIYNNGFGKEALTPLGFHSDQGAVVLAYLFMQLHITIAFAVLLHPAFFLFERMLLGMHHKKPDDIEAVGYDNVETPLAVNGEKSAANRQSSRYSHSRASKHSVVSMADIEKEDLDDEHSDEEYKGGNVIKYVLLRLAMVAILVVMAVLLKDHFMTFADFIGASAITASCIVLPIVFYLKVMWTKVPIYEKIPAIFVAVVCTFFGIYVTYHTGVELFSPETGGAKFPFCPADYENVLYYNKTNATLSQPTRLL